MINESGTLGRLLILDDTVELAELIGAIATNAGFETTMTSDIDSFNLELERAQPGMIILDLQMPEADGVEILKQLAADQSNAGILLISGMDKRTIDSAVSFGRTAGLNMLGSLQKPFEPESLLAKLSKIRSATRQLTDDDLAAAIDNSSLVLHFQPVIRRIEKNVWHAESVEALLRWEHPALGLLAPGQFLPLVGSDRSSLMRRLTDFVFQRGIEYLQTWQNVGLHLGLRVNVAAGFITDTDFPDRLENFLAQHQADPSLLTLEIGDSATVSHSADCHEILTRLRLKGVNLALDDFGAPGQPLESLYRLPINEIKIDKSITAGLQMERGSSVVLRGLVEMAAQLGISSCVEGVETAEQFNLIDEIGCDLAQGFHVGRPVVAREISAALAAWIADADSKPSAVTAA